MSITTETIERAIRGGSCETACFPCDPVRNGHAPVRLNLGAGPHPLPGYENLDRKTGQEVYPLDYPDNHADEIRASHILEHFSHREEVGAVLREWVRVLKPDGVLKIAVPNFEWIAQAYLDQQPIDVQGYVMGGHGDADDRHGCIFDHEQLALAMRVVGLWDIRPWKSTVQDCASLPCSLNLRGRKKAPMPALKLACAMSVPRLGFQDNFYSLVNALLPLGITPTMHTGAFWGQCLERVMTKQLMADYILTLDYDSVFSIEDVEHLIRVAVKHPDADAVAAMQLRRHDGSALAVVSGRETIAGENGERLQPIDIQELEESELFAVQSAHFGLTLIRCAALRDLPHPWFLGVPGKDGLWGDDRTDDDVYFWSKWRAEGRTVYLAPHVVVAHGEFMLTWPDKMGRPIHQHPSEFWSKGKPEGVWR